MIVYEAPAKLNLALHVKAARPDGMHPVESLAQTIEWCDLLEVEEGDGEDNLRVEVEGAAGEGLSDKDNLVLKALAAARVAREVGPLRLTLRKRLPVAAGLGGGSSDAAALLLAVGAPDAAAEVGADVPLFLTGGTSVVGGVGDVVEPAAPLSGFAAAVAAPGFGLATPDVYRRWDEMEGPEGEATPPSRLPPPLRESMPVRNDLLPAALDLEPRLGDFMADVRGAWGVPVLLTGSGSACFGLFGALDEAESAAESVSSMCRESRGAELRPCGVRKV